MEDIQRQAPRKNQRKVMFKSYSAMNKVDDTGLDNVGSNRVDIDPFDPFVSMYEINNLIAPPLNFKSLYSMAEDSDIVSACIAAYRKNIDGFGYRLDFLGDDRTELNTKEAQQQYENAIQFFDNPNPDSSFHMIRDSFRRDFEVLGQSAFEIVRFRTGGISAVYYIPMVDLRMSTLDATPVVAVTSMFREGRWRKVNIKKRFRRFAQLQGDGITLRWFRQFGDKRILDAVTGEYKNSRKECIEVATEIFMIQQPTSGRTYALPRYIANATDIKGRANAAYVNYDVLNTQGVPPMALLCSGGTLTDESKQELRNWAESMRGPENFNRLALLECEPNLLGIDDKGVVKIELKNLMDYRANDFMFEGYLKSTAETIRQSFRLPSMYLGQMDSASYASSYTIVKVAESQVFQPERDMFDEEINRHFLWGELGCTMWKYVSQGPQIVTTEELRLSLKELVAAGALTTNNCIDIANKLFNMTISKYDEVWADLPISLVKLQANLGSFQLEEITNNDPKGGSVALPPKEPGKPPTGSESTTPPIPSRNPRGF